MSWYNFLPLLITLGAAVTPLCTTVPAAAIPLCTADPAAAIPPFTAEPVAVTPLCTTVPAAVIPPFTAAPVAVTPLCTADPKPSTPLIREDVSGEVSLFSDITAFFFSDNLREVSSSRWGVPSTGNRLEPESCSPMFCFIYIIY